MNLGAAETGRCLIFETGAGQLVLDWSGVPTSVAMPADPSFGLGFLLDQDGKSLVPDRPLCVLRISTVAEVNRPATASGSAPVQLPTGTWLQYHPGGDGWQMVFGDDVVLTRGTDPSRLNMEVVPYWTQDTLLAAGDALVAALEHTLERAECTMVHAACVHFSRDDGDTAAFMLHAPSGAGKTTTALALALAGHPLQSDDTCILRAAKQIGDTPTVEVQGLPRDPRVHRRSVAMLPPLEAAIDVEAWDEGDEQFIARQRLPDLFVEPDPVPLRGLISLARNTGPLRIESADPYDAFLRLAEDNLAFRDGAFMPGHALRLDLMTMALASAPAFHVSGDGSPSEIAKLISYTMESVV